MTTPDSAHTQGRRPERFTARIHEVARYLVSRIEPANLQEIDEKFPNLSVHDLVGATALVQALRMEWKGTHEYPHRDGSFHSARSARGRHGHRH